MIRFIYLIIKFLKLNNVLHHIQTIIYKRNYIFSFLNVFLALKVQLITVVLILISVKKRTYKQRL